MSNEKKFALSASRIKVADSCSWLYYCNYVLNLPRTSNDGSNRGNVVHEVLEALSKPSRREYVEQLKDNPESIPSIYRYTFKVAKRYGVCDPKNLKLIFNFIKVGLNSDFFYEGGDLQKPEYNFELGDPDKDGYHIIGFIDKHALFKDSKLIRIADYKSSKDKMKKQELEGNLQALTYSLVMAKEYPDYDCQVDFIFVKFPKYPVESVSFSKQQLAGFEEYLRGVYSYLKNFTYENAQESFAAEKGYDKNWMCGRDVSYPGQLKDDGQPKWYCPARFPFTYYAVIDEKGNNLRTAYTLNDLKIKTGENVKRKSYAGCKYFFP